MMFHLSVAFALLGSVCLAATKPVLKGISFKENYLEEFFDADTKAVVLFFSATHCPLVRQYIPTLNKLRATYEPQKVKFLAIYSDKAVNVYSMGMHVVKHDLSLRPLWDQDSRLAKELGAEITTQTIVINREKKILYSGAIDDQFTVASRKPAPTENHLKDALDEIVSGHSVKRAETRASGCQIELYDSAQRPEKKTYYEHVAPIIQEKCLSCHRPGEVGSTFTTFTSYDEVAPFSDTIRQVVLERRMPPFYGTFNEKFAKPRGHRTLTDDEVAIIDAWAQTGAEAGDPKNAPPKKIFSPQEWLIGNPDLIIGMEKPFKIPATGTLDYQFFKVKLNFPDDRWVQAAEIKPGNSEVVHHMELHLVPSNDEDYSGPNGMMKLYGLTGEEGKFLQSYVPGDTDDNARVFPSGQAVRIPKNHDVVFEIHYTTTGKATTDQSKAALIFAKQAPETEICTHTFRVKRAAINIPAHTGHVSLSREMWFRKDVNIHSVRAHMHRIGKSFRLEWLNRGENGAVTKEWLMAIPSWDFNWQRSMDLEKPLLVLAGQEILMTGYWDNSKFNPANLDPQNPKLWGLQTQDEMLNTRVKFSIIKKPGETVTCKEAIP